MYTILPRSQGAILGIEISGKVEIDQEQALVAKADELIREHGKISLLVVLGEHVGTSFDAAMADMKWTLGNMKHLAKVAIVSDSRLLAALTAVDAAFARMAGIEEKHFDKADLDAAWTWIAS
jgi:hypothetical protein